MQKDFTIENIDNIAQSIINKAKDAPHTRATIIALSGDLGAGKTTLSSSIARALGSKDIIISPTFVIMKKYSLRDPDFDFLIHIDAYRLNKSAELHTLGWEDIYANSKNLIIIEWPEHVQECLASGTCHIKLSHIDEDTRRIEFRS